MSHSTRPVVASVPVAMKFSPVAGKRTLDDEPLSPEQVAQGKMRSPCGRTGATAFWLVDARAPPFQLLWGSPSGRGVGGRVSISFNSFFPSCVRTVVAIVVAGLQPRARAFIQLVEYGGVPIPLGTMDYLLDEFRSSGTSLASSSCSPMRGA